MSLQQANHAFDQSNFVEAARLYTEYLGTRPEDCCALTSLAACLYHQGEPASASILLAQALRINDAFVPALLNMSVLLNDQHRAYESLAFTFRVKLLVPDHSLASVEFAYSLLLSGSSQQALDVLAAVPPMPGFLGGRMHFVRGRCEELLGRWREAEGSYMAALHCNDRDVYQHALIKLRTAIFRRRAPLLQMRQTHPLLAGLDDNLFRLVIKRC